MNANGGTGSCAHALRALLAQPGALLLPGVFDALSARLAERAGFHAVYFSGSAVAMSLLGLPDLGLLAGPEVVDQTRRVADAITIPLVVDADTGYGNPLNVARTVRALEAAGAAGVQLEDQQFPKRCGHFEGKGVISASEMVMKIRAAVEARRDAELVIVGRTDAAAVLGIDEAIKRGQAYRAAGADVIFVEAPRTTAELRAVAERIAPPVLVNVVEGGKTPHLPFAQYEALGFKVVLYPTAGVRVAAKALGDFYAYLHGRSTSEAFPGGMVSFAERNEINDLARFERMEARYSS